VCPIRFAFIFTRSHLLRGGLIELEQIDSADPSLAVHGLYGGRDHQYHCHRTKKYSNSVGLLAVVPLALQFFTGLYLFVLPYATKRRERRTAEGAAFHVHLATINVMSSDCSWELNLRA
jgi:hypothetical protein